MSLEKKRWEYGELVISRARKIDAMPMLSIHREVLSEGPYFITQSNEFSLTVDQQTRRITKFLESDQQILLVAKVRRVPVGFLSLQTGPLARMQHCVKLELMVAAKARGQGIGKRLMSCAMEWASAHPSLDKIGLTVFADNSRAVDLYRSFGFTEEGRRVNEYLLEDGSYRDDILMGVWVGGQRP